MSREAQVLEFVKLAKTAVEHRVTRSKFVIPSGELQMHVWERRIRGLAYDVAKGMANAIKNPRYDGVDLPTGNGTVTLALALGMGAYAQVGSDRYPYTVIGYSTNGKHLFVQQDKFIRTDKNGQSEDQSYVYEPNPNAVPEKAIWSPKYERYYLLSNSILYLGTRRAYQDPGF